MKDQTKLENMHWYLYQSEDCMTSSPAALKPTREGEWGFFSLMLGLGRLPASEWKHPLQGRCLGLGRVGQREKQKGLMDGPDLTWVAGGGEVPGPGCVAGGVRKDLRSTG